MNEPSPGSSSTSGSAQDEHAPLLTIPAERRLLALLATVQFVNLVDFVIMMPLGPRFSEDLGISDQQFGGIVAAYGYAAGISGLLAAFFIDRLPRKGTLITLLVGFTFGTFLCAVAGSHTGLVVARAIAGLFGGVLGGFVLTVIGDAIPPARRGAATGIAMLGFSAASVLGLPLGLILSAHFTWHTPFFALVALSLLVVGAAILWFPPLPKTHVQADRNHALALWETMIDPNHLMAYALMACLMIAGFTVAPYIATYLERHVGLPKERMWLVYLCGGVCTLVTVPLFGRLSDRHGRLLMFRILALSSIVPMLVLTMLPKSPIVVALLVTTAFMVCTSGRGVPAMALIVGSAAPGKRASFMSVNGSVQQFSMGLATTISALILGDDKGLSRYPIVGVVASLATVACVFLASTLSRADIASKRPAIEHDVVEEWAAEAAAVESL